MARPVRLAYRSREAGEGGIDVRARVCPPRPRGRWVRRIRGRVIAGPVPPAPRSSAVVDPRIGDLGPALLALEDGSLFPGVAFGAPVAAGGDLVVNTSQTGYQEVCTDPSYAGQVVVMTYPLIGNYGRLADEDQSTRPWLRALVVANATAAVLDDARQLAALLRDASIPAIAGVDTRALARHLRANGCLRGIVTAPGETDPDAARAAALAVPRWEDQDFVGQVSPSSIMDVGRMEDGGPLIGIVDFGLKSNIVLAMRRRGARVRVLPAHDLGVGGARPRDRRPDPFARARGSGPARRARSRWRRRSSTTAGRCSGSASAIRSSAARRAPTRPACGSATTARTTRSATSTPASSRSRPRTTRSRWSPGPLPAASGFRVSQLNLNDGSVEGLRHAELPIETVQYHPEGAPGPLDALAVFDRFVTAATARRGGH